MLWREKEKNKSSQRWRCREKRWEKVNTENQCQSFCSVKHAIEASNKTNQSFYRYPVHVYWSYHLYRSLARAHSTVQFAYAAIYLSPRIHTYNLLIMMPLLSNSQRIRVPLHSDTFGNIIFKIHREIHHSTGFVHIYSVFSSEWISFFSAQNAKNGKFHSTGWWGWNVESVQFFPTQFCSFQM